MSPGYSISGISRNQAHTHRLSDIFLQSSFSREMVFVPNMNGECSGAGQEGSLPPHRSHLIRCGPDREQSEYDAKENLHHPKDYDRWGRTRLIVKLQFANLMKIPRRFYYFFP